MWKKLLCCYSVLVVIFTILIILVHLIPSKLLREHVFSSAETIEKEGIFWQIGDIYLLQIDNMTDCMMMNMALTADEHHPVESAMNNYYCCNEIGEGYVNMALNTMQAAVKGCESLPERIHYGRYWQGIQVLLRPLLIITDYTGIRIINYVLLSILLIWLLYLLIASFGWMVPSLFVISLLLVAAPIVPLSIQLSVCFYIMLASSILIMYYNSLLKAPLIFFVIGAVTSYFDFLTVPQITLGIPLILLLLKKQKETQMKYVILFSFSWFLGYSLLWASKWLVAYLLTGQSIMESVMGSISLRLSDSVVFHGEEITIYSLFVQFLNQLKWWMPFILLILLFSACFLYYRYQKGIAIIKRYSWLLLIALIVPFWFICLRNHSIQHIFFTWRAWLVPLFSLMLFVYFTTKKQISHE